jgi:hypothetical protein
LQLAVYAWALEKQGILSTRAGFWDARTGHVLFGILSNLPSDRVEDILNTFDKASKETDLLA